MKLKFSSVIIKQQEFDFTNEEKKDALDLLGQIGIKNLLSKNELFLMFSSLFGENFDIRKIETDKAKGLVLKINNLVEKITFKVDSIGIDGDSDGEYNRRRFDCVQFGRFYITASGEITIEGLEHDDIQLMRKGSGVANINRGFAEIIEL